MVDNKSADGGIHREMSGLKRENVHVQKEDCSISENKRGENSDIFCKKEDAESVIQNKFSDAIHTEFSQLHVCSCEKTVHVHVSFNEQKEENKCDDTCVEEIQEDSDSYECNNCNNSRQKLTKSEKKKLRYAHIVEERRKNRKQKKAERKKRIREQNELSTVNTNHPTKREIQEEIRRKLDHGLIHGQRICIDLGMEHTMSTKEKSKLAQQIGRLYGANRHTESPAHVYLCGLQIDGELYKECVRKNDGFLDYVMERTDKPVWELFSVEDIIYLSPDATETLTDIEKEKVYVIGGLVDESVKKNLTQSTAECHRIKTFKLPISLYMDKVEQTSYSQILAVNQVFEILMTFIATRDWRKALSVGVPKRKGYVVNDKVS